MCLSAWFGVAAGPLCAQDSVESGVADVTAEDDAEAEAEERELPTDDVVATLRGVVSGEGAPGAEPIRRVEWREDWPRYSFDEAVLSLGLGALLIIAEVLPTATTDPNWRGGIIFDDGVREGLRLRSYEARESARIASDVLMWTLTAWPFVVDALAVVGIGENHWDAAFQMGLIGLEAYIISLVVWKLTALLARRERPVASACEEGLDSPHCTERLETTSFMSNHAVNAFTGASLVCLHHTHMPLWGDEAADTMACVGAMTAAGVVGLLRVMSDFEYLTDVIAGAVIGFASGYIIPWLLHYQGGARPELRPAPPVAIIPVPMIGAGETYGLAAAGWF